MEVEEDDSRPEKWLHVAVEVGFLSAVDLYLDLQVMRLAEGWVAGLLTAPSVVVMEAQASFLVVTHFTEAPEERLALTFLEIANPFAVAQVVDLAPLQVQEHKILVSQFTAVLEALGEL